MSPLPQVVPEAVRSGLVRAARRWEQLPLDRARAALPGVHDLMADLAGEPLPDLGPAVVIDQLRVVVHDRCARAAEAPDDEERPADLADRLAALRLSWS